MSQGGQVRTLFPPRWFSILRGSTELRVLAVLLFVAVAAGCGPGDAEVRLARAAAERRSLEEMMDHLEDRLIVNQARVRFWREMKARHESVSAIACVSLEEHATEMASRLPPPQRSPSSLHRARVASVSASAPDAQRREALVPASH
jgi:hypothetical protein